MPVRNAEHVFGHIWYRESSIRVPNDTLYGHVLTLNTSFSFNAAGSTRAAAPVLPHPVTRIETETVVSGARRY